MPDFTLLAGVDQGLYIVVFVLALVFAFRAGRLAARPPGPAMASSARWTFSLGCLTLLAAMAQWLQTWLLFDSFGWLYINDKLLGFLPLILAPAIAVALVSLPRLWRLGVRVLPFPVRTGESDEEQAAWRTAAAAPETIVPIHALSLGAFLAAALQFVSPAVTLDTGSLIGAWGTLIAGTSALWIGQSWRQQRFGRPGPLHKAHPLIRFLRFAILLLLVWGGIATWFNQALEASRLPDRMNMAEPNAGGQENRHAHAANAQEQHASGVSRGQSVSVTELTGPRSEIPDRRFTLTAQKTQLALPSGKSVEAWTYNGQYPGPELRMREGELIEVVLENRDIPEGVTIHWHGLNVPNAEDGVAGATQDAVLPGEKHVYRFVAKQTGTYWYHSHQQSSVQVKKGLFGPLVIESANEAKSAKQPSLDLTLVHHKLNGGGGFTLSGKQGVTKEQAAPGTPVRLRLINADSSPAYFQLLGSPYQVAAIDGNDVHDPNLIANQTLLIAAGGRYDITFTMPQRPVFLSQSRPDGGRGLLLSPDGTGEAPPPHPDLPVFDPAGYGSPVPLPFDRAARFDRDFRFVFDVQLGFYDGRLDGLWAINGKVFPDTPMLMVQEGDLVKMTFVNRSYMDHPMHLHGHHMLVLSRNGTATTGSPWWTDTLNVAPGETYEVAFRADNPGLWMDHCHNLTHARVGMTMHLVYEGVTTPFLMGRQTRNQPE